MHAAKLLLEELRDDEDEDDAEDKDDDENEEEDNKEDEDDGKADDLKRLKLPPSRLDLKLGFPSSLLCLPTASPCTNCQTQVQKGRNKIA